MATIRDRLDAAQAVMQSPRGTPQPSPLDNLDTIRKHLERLNDTLGELPELIRVMSRKLDNPVRLSVRSSQQKPIVGTTGWNNRIYVPNAGEVVAVGAYVPGPALDIPIRLRFNGSTLDESPQFYRFIAGPVAQPQYIELTGQPLSAGAPALVVLQYFTSWQGGWLFDNYYPQFIDVSDRSGRSLGIVTALDNYAEAALFSSFVITDTAAHASTSTGVLATNRNKSLYVFNGLNQSVSIQLQVSRDGVTWVTPGNSPAQAVAAATNAVFGPELLQALSQTHFQYRITATAAVAPTTGGLTAYIDAST